MNIRTILPALALLLLGTVADVRADIARPQPQPSPSKQVLRTGLQVVPDSKTWNARLQISEATLRELREATNAGATSQSFGQRLTSSSTNTIMAGLFLFMSISFAGLWLARSPARARTGKAMAAVVIMFGTVGMAAIIARANAAPPGSYYWRNLSKNLTAGKATTGEIDIEIVSEGDSIKLIIPTRDARNSDD